MVPNYKSIRLYIDSKDTQTKKLPRNGVARVLGCAVDDHKRLPVDECSRQR